MCNPVSHLQLCWTSPEQTSISNSANVTAVYSMQGNCAVQPLEHLEVPRRTRTQCVITVLEDFLEVQTESAPVWISDLYVKHIGVENNHSTFVGGHGGDVYLTDMILVGDGDGSRGIEVNENSKLYASSVLSPLFLTC